MSKRPLIQIDLTGNDDEEEDSLLAVVAVPVPEVSSTSQDYELAVLDKVALKDIRSSIENYYARDNIPTHVKTDILPALMTLDDGQLYRKESSIAGAGLGLYCTRPIRRGELITYYDGLRVDNALLEALDTRFGNEAKAYAHALDEEQTLVSNIVFSEDPELSQRTQTVPLKRKALSQIVLLDRDRLGTHFKGRGAMQFANTALDSKSSSVNTQIMRIQDKRRFTAKELREAKFDVIPEANERLVRAFPDAALIVLYATKDIPADTELLYFYGKRYVKAHFRCSSQTCGEKARFRCVQCKRAFYCSRACQERAWLHEDHASDCVV